MNFSLAILHAKRKPERVRALMGMINDLIDPAVLCRVFDDDKGDESWKTFQHKIARAQWQWSLDSGAEHCVFMTDDLAIAPRFWEVLSAMVRVRSNDVLGLLSNHPAGPALAQKGYRWYRTNSWLVGPCYVMPRLRLEAFVRWYDAMPEAVRAPFNDDSIINEWVSMAGPRQTYHPLPTLIEHLDLESTWCPGDGFSKQRLSWRSEFQPVDTGHGFEWPSKPAAWDIEAMASVVFWHTPAPMLQVGGASADEAGRVPTCGS